MLRSQIETSGRSNPMLLFAIAYAGLIALLALTMYLDGVR